MINHPNFDPVAVHLGPLDIRWYSLGFLAGFACVIWLGSIRAKNNPKWNSEVLQDLVFYGALGAILGGRIGYVLFYNLSYYLENPRHMLAVWQGGLSFHGGFIGVLIAMYFFARKKGFRFLEVTDYLAPLVGPGLGFVRVANFINQELWGAPTDKPWGVVFTDPNAGGAPRHPSQIYEAMLEGLLLFIVVWIYTRIPRSLGKPTGLAMMFYGCARFFIEFFRLPDSHIGYLAFDWLTMGQILSTPMIIIGAMLFFRAKNTSRVTN